MKKIFTSFIMLWLVTQFGIMSYIQAQGPAALPYIQDFNTANDLTLVNGTQTNKWEYGAATGNAGNSLYISNNGGTANAYNTGSTSVVSAYRDLSIPAASTVATLSFDWKSYGEDGYDFLKVWMVPASYTPTAGTAITTGGGRIQVGSEMSTQSSWQNYLNINLNVSSFAGSTMRLVFEWSNDGSVGTQPPAAIDNINLSIPTCLAPSAPLVTTVTSDTGSISWTGITPAPTNGYEYYYSTTNTPPTAATPASGTSTVANATINGLAPSTTYYFWVRSACSATDKSIWISGSSFTTTQVPAAIPYTQNFNTNDFGFVNGTQVNQWAYGAATGNTGNSIYISNNNGTANAYTTGTSVVSHAYRDIAVPTGTTVTTFSFDWKAIGEGFTTNFYDYLRVWLVPASFVPTEGTQITAGNGRIQVGGNMNNQATWANYLNSSLNISSFANTTMRLVFEWTNDASGGTQPPVAIDNVNLFIPSCVIPSALAVNNITAGGATLSWTAPTPAPANGYDYYITTTNTPPAATATPTGSVTANSVVLNNLTSNTTYYFWVRSVCGTGNNSAWTAGPAFTTPQIAATIPYSQNFNSNDFGFNNGTQTNKWAYGSAIGNTGNSIYISNNNGTANSYTLGSTSTVHAFRDISVPAGTTIAALSFDWKGIGEGFTTTNYDYLRVWLVPSSFVPTAGTQITAGTGRIQVGGNMNNQATWATYLNSNLNISSFAGQTMRLVFEWRNDGSGGTQPPVAIDNINLAIPTCINPLALAVNTVTANGATISWTAPTPAPGNGYQYYITTTNTPPTQTTTPTGTATGTSVVLTNLNPNTTYYFWVRSRCTTTDYSLWSAGPSFTTTQIPATIPYIQDFSGANDFGFSNGTQTNKWSYGAATGNTGNSIYISNDNGTANAYTTSSSSVVQAYRDIAVPAGATDAEFGFDWKAVGETNYDYLRVWLVPTSYQPVAGTQITAGTGRIQVGANYGQQTTWQNFLNQTFNISSFAGQTMRLVFEWRNDGSAGTQPPAAIDNIRLLICNNAMPTVTVGTVTHNTAVLNWNQDLGGATYTIRYRPTGTAAWQTVTVAAAPYPATTNTTTLTNLLPATPYEVEIAAVCKNIPGQYSQDTLVTRCDPTPPNVTVTNITSTSALVSWNPLAISATYELQWREVGTTVWNTPTIPQPPANSYLLDGLSSNKTYEVMVRNTCVGETTPNPWSNPQVFTTIRVCEIAPPGLTINQLNPTSAEISWDAYTGTGATGTYILRYRKVGIPSWTNLNVNTNTVTITGLLELTKYEMQVANICSGTPGSFTPLYYFSTPTVVYCQMTSANGSTDYIDKVTVTPAQGTPMENQSGAGTYSNFTTDATKFITLIQGSSGNTIKINKTSTEATGVAVWIDFNRNGAFDLDEKIVADGPNTSDEVNATFSVPADAFVSMTDYKYVVMRVAMQKGSIPINCISFQDGEVEDYTVRIVKLPASNLINPTDVIIYPNPVSTVLNVKNISAKANYKIYSAAGQLVSNGIILNNKINVSSLINGVYIIELVDGDKTVQKKFIKE